MVDNNIAQEAEFHGILFTRLQDYIHSNATEFELPVAEKTVDSGRADIFIPNPLNGDLVIEVKRDDVYPRDREVIRQARNYADDLGTQFFATCNSNDLFLFKYSDEIKISQIEFIYFNLRNKKLSKVVNKLLSDIEYVHKKGKLPVQQERERIVGVLRSFHSSNWPTYEALANKKYGRNEQFSRAFDDWIRQNDYSALSKGEQFAIAAKQYAYLLTNRVLFYEIVRQKTRARYDPDVGGMMSPIETESGLPLDPLTDYTTSEYLSTHLRKQFNRIIKEVDYRPVFEDDTDLFGVFPENQKTLAMLEDFINNIESERITELNEDLLGEVYEQLIPAKERRELGQFYTHPKIAKTLSEWAVARPDETTLRPSERIPRVLDPACGSGTFTVETYNILAGLYDESTHQQIVDALFAVDINRFPLHLTALNLSSQKSDKETDHLNIFHDSFFNMDPETERLINTKMDSTRESAEKIGKFDAVVGNPPYIRQGDLHPNKSHFRSHLSVFGRVGYSTYFDGSKELSGKSDAYVYFMTHATQFLRNGGRLAFIVPNKWLTTRYGETLQEFLFDHYRLVGIVGFTARAFDDALVDTVMVMLERCEEESERRKQTIPFVRVRETMDSEDIIDTVTVNYDTPSGSYMQIRDRPAYRVTAVEQSYLMEIGPKKLLPYIRAPSEFIELLEHPAFVPLNQDIGSIKRGTMTGANDFFFVSEKDKNNWTIDDRFLHPAIKSIKDVDSFVIMAEDSNKYLFDIHGYAEQIRHDDGGLASNSDLETRVKDALERDGYSGARSYIEWGERENHHTGATCQNRSIWFDLGKLNPPEILHPKFFNDDVYTIGNPDRLMPSNAIDCINLEESVNSDSMVAFFHSTVYKALLETWGRAEGGGALQLMTYEVSSIPVLDVRKLENETQENLANLKERIIRGNVDAKEDVDELILEILDLEISAERFRNLYDAMVHRRIDSGAEAEVMVENMDDYDGEVTRTFTRSGGESPGLSEYY
jgi:type I restriction-modification system DNA methylase subunit